MRHVESHIEELTDEIDLGLRPVSLSVYDLDEKVYAAPIQDMTTSLLQFWRETSW